MAEESTAHIQGSVINEVGLSYREVNILKRWVTNSGREEKRLNFVIKGIYVEEELKDREKGQRRREEWVKEWVEEKLEVECNIVAARESVYVVEGEEKKKRKSWKISTN